MFKNKINEYKQEAIELLKNLISYKSVLDEYNPNSEAPFGLENKKVLEFLLKKASEDGFIVKNTDNYAGHIEYGFGEQILGVLGHLDVVPVVESEWDSDPFKLSIRDGKMYARGSVDDKGPVVAAYIALKILKDMGFKPNKRIRLIVGCDEESGSRCLHHYFKTEEKPALGFSPDAEFPLIYGEKAMLSYDIYANIEDDIFLDFKCGERYNIVPSMAKAKIKVNLDNEFLSYLKNNNYEGKIEDGYYVTYGVAAHAMCPEKGVNAAFILFDFLAKNTNSKLAKFVSSYLLFDTLGKKLGYDYYDEDMKELTSNLAVVHMNENIIKIGVNCRVPVNEQLAVIEKCVAKAVAEYGYDYKVLGSSLRHYVDPNSNLVKTLLKCYQEVTNDYDSKPITIGGGTYAREIGNAVAFGPLFVGREDVCHIANEYIFEDDFYASIEIYLKSIYELCK